MKSSIVLKRLVLPAEMSALLLLAMAYWWQGNLWHELFGTGLFALLAWHIGVNRRWFTGLLRGPYDAPRVLTVGLHLGLIFGMGLLLVTSVAISDSLLAALPQSDSFALRQVHLFTAYWVMIAVGAHLGLHWTRVMATTRGVLRLSPANTLRTWTLRVVAAALFLLAFDSVATLDLRSKLTFTPSLSFWDFSTSVTPFFWHWAAVLSLPAIPVHYGVRLLRARR